MYEGTSPHETEDRCTLSKLSSPRRYRILTSKIISITFVLLGFVVLMPKGTLSAPSLVQDEGDVSNLKQEVRQCERFQINVNTVAKMLIFQ